MKKLHPNQQKLLNILRDNYTDPLTIREMMELLDVSSPSVVQHHIQQLENKGYLRRNPSNPKDYHILADSPDKKITYLNLYGLAQCGPNGTLLDGDPIDQIPISTKLLGFPAEEAFMVKARGDSMEPRIHENDIVIAQKSNGYPYGSTVVCVYDGGAMIKVLKQTANGTTILHSLNDKYPPIIVEDDFPVEGIVKGVLQYS